MQDDLDLQDLSDYLVKTNDSIEITKNRVRLEVWPDGMIYEIKTEIREIASPPNYVAPENILQFYDFETQTRDFSNFAAFADFAELPLLDTKDCQYPLSKVVEFMRRVNTIETPEGNVFTVYLSLHESYGEIVVDWASGNVKEDDSPVVQFLKTVLAIPESHSDYRFDDLDELARMIQ